MLDYKIIGGQVLDGTGADPIRADIGITGDRIEVIGDLGKAEAATMIHATGRCVAPGFIDVHSHSDAYLLIEPSAPSKLYQGITTEIVGNCGASAAPLKEAAWLPSDWREQIYPSRWRSVADYRRLLEQARPAPNVVLLIGHGKLRAWVMGYQARPATADEVRAMARLLEQSMNEGGRGLSTGLIYAPGLFAAPDELAELARVVAQHTGIYTTHMRSEGIHLLEAIEETLAIGRETGIRLEISHLKTSGRSNWEKAEAALELIRRARQAGVEVAADRYPYMAGNTDLDVILPDWAQAGGRDAVMRRLRDPDERKRLRKEMTASRLADDWKGVMIGSTAEASFRGRSLPEVAQALGVDSLEAALRLMESDELKTSAFFFGMSEDNMWKILAAPFVMLGSDASLRSLEGPLSRDFPHPRAYGAFPKFLRAALDGKTVTLPEAIRKMTSLPADHFRLKGRGRVAVGAYADLVIFDPNTVVDRATYAVPHALSQGVECVMVNGIPTLDQNGLTVQRAGRVL
ncbi:MAG: D-aminoacylase [Kiritimatiellae bacterium]|nr:D-aminoacylase [Kiritimatiellia bacterium]